MNEVMTGFDQLVQQHLYIDFIVINVLTVYLLLKYVLPNRSEQFRITANIVACALFTIAFAYIWGYNIPRLLISSLSTVAFYQWIVKYLMRMFDIEYQKPLQ